MWERLGHTQKSNKLIIQSVDLRSEEIWGVLGFNNCT